MRQLTIDIVDIKFLLIETLYLMLFLFNISKLPTCIYIALDDVKAPWRMARSLCLWESPALDSTEAHI